MRRALAALAPAIAVLACGCTEAEFDLAIDVRTDLAPGVDFAAVRTETGPLPLPLSGAAWVRARAADVAAFRGQEYLEGHRVAEVGGLTRGVIGARVRLLDSSGATVVERLAIIDVRGSTAVTIVLSRDCRGVVCPSPTDEETATTCAGGRCVSPDCAADGVAGCGEPVCTADADCGSAAACAETRCTGDACLVRPVHTRCADDERCDVAAGCVPIDPACASDGATCDDGFFCNGADECADGACAVHAGSPCSGTTCDEESDTCASPPPDAGPPPTCPDGMGCDDGNPCTHGDRCSGGGCSGTSYSCGVTADCYSSSCDGAGGCSPSAYLCGPGSTCSGGSCVACGGADQICCAGSCIGGLGCLGGVCTCGQIGNVCCPWDMSCEPGAFCGGTTCFSGT